MLLFQFSAEDPSDRQFIEELYHQYNRLMYRKALDNLADPQDVDDLVQDCLERLIKQVGTLRKLSGCTLTAYIVYTVRNTAINMKRRREVQSRHVFLSDFSELEPEDSSLSPEDALLVDERSEHFMQAFAELSEDDQFLLIGKYIQGLRDEELAQMMGCGAASVRMKLTRARRRALRKLREGEYFSETT